LDTGKENYFDNLYEMYMKQKDMKRVKTIVNHGSKMTMQELVCDGVVANTVPMMRVTGTTVIDGVKYKTLTF
jgi:hypothetical protein